MWKLNFTLFADFDERILKQQQEEEERKRLRREKKKEKVWTVQIKVSYFQLLQMQNLWKILFLSPHFCLILYSLFFFILNC